MIGVLGKARKPDTVWQRQFDHDDDALRRLARADWDDVKANDLGAYFHDLAYVELQPDLFRHVFPACLHFWYGTLLQSKTDELYGGEFTFALARSEVMIKLMTDKERTRLNAFFIDGLLDRVDLERGFGKSHQDRSAHATIGRFNTLGLIAPIIPEIWRAWWAMTTPGQAVSAINYASGLIYLKGENPLFAAWTPEKGGGGPYLTEWDASIFDRAWLPANHAFLGQTLTPEYLIERLAAAAKRLKDEPEAAMARRIADDAAGRRDVIEIRIEDVLRNLAKVQLEHDWADWR